MIHLLSARLFGHGHHHDLSQRAAVLLSALRVGASHWLGLAALNGVGAAGMASAWSLFSEAVAPKLDAAPRHIDLQGLEQALLDQHGGRAVRQLHGWG